MADGVRGQGRGVGPYDVGYDMICMVDMFWYFYACDDVYMILFFVSMFHVVRLILSVFEALHLVHGLAGLFNFFQSDCDGAGGCF